MPKHIPALFALTLCVACADAGPEQLSTITVDGEQYTVVTQTVTEGNRTFDASRVRVNNIERPCDIALSGDCAAAVRKELNDTD
ncbi:MAG: hypothetical protein AAGF27_10615 [Pseudomonadota bacterium]